MLKLVKRCLQGRVPQSFNRNFTFNRDIVARTTRQSHHLYQGHHLSLMLGWNAARSRFITMAVLYKIAICELAYYFIVFLSFLTRECAYAL